MTLTLTPEARAFVDAVRAELADLPEDDVVELLEDVEQHLAEAAADGRLGDLGSPAAYAAELRAAAGLPARAGGGHAWAPVRRVRGWLAVLMATRWYGEVRAFAPELRPGWWVLRGYLLVVALAYWTHHSLHQVVPIPHVSGNALLGLLATAAAIVGSVAWGRRRAAYTRVPRGLTIAVNVVTALVALAVLNSASQRSYYYDYVPASYPPAGLHGPFGQVNDIYPYDAEGQPLEGVRLYDRSGNALAPQVCDTYCPRLSFPLYDDPRPPIGPGSDYRMQTPWEKLWVPAPAVPTTAPTAAAPTPTAKPTPKPTPTAKRK